MGGTLKDRLVSLFDIRGLGWQLALFLAALLIGGSLGTIVFWASLRDALSDFLAADVAVWHPLITIGATGILALVVWWFARWQPGNSEGRMTDTRPVEVEQFGVLWPIYHPHGGGLRVGKPMCPRDRSTLGYFVENKLVSLLNDWDDTITAPQMSFGCPKEDCGRKYDLTVHKYHMRDMTGLVHDVAMGEWRAASRQHG
jgi:hypothetical protein